MTGKILHATDWISKLDLAPHPEGGYFREVYRSSEQLSRESLPDRFTGSRHLCTSIYFLLQSGDFSGFHRIRSDEIWHFYAGDPLDIYIIRGAKYERVVLGLDIANDQTPQFMVPHGAWFASRTVQNGSFSLVGCTVSPGFDFSDLEMGGPDLVFQDCPERRATLGGLCRV